jgi:diguanylate cyclase (GGDEF)-like protein
MEETGKGRCFSLAVARGVMILMHIRTQVRDFVHTLGFQERIFYDLVLLGLIVAVLSLVGGIVTGLSLAGMAAVVVDGIYLLLIIAYSLYTRNLDNSRLAACIGYNFIFFPLAFIYTGGSSGGMPLYFVFGVVLIALLLKGRLSYILLLASMLFDLGLMLYSYDYPFQVAAFASPFQALLDKMQSFVIVAGVLSLAIMLLLAEYDKKDKKIQSLNKQLKRLAMVDPLTQIYNRGYLQERLIMMLENDMKARLAVIMFDVDFFKKVNDTYGHLAGDSVLKTVAAILKQEIRLQGIVGRYGGEEFVVVLKDADEKQAAEVAERIRCQVERASVGQEYDLSVTVSGGVAEYDAQMLDVKSLFMAADEKLYQAKAAGRNCIVA